ncbi:MAG: hypothetical protein H0V87_09290 [Chloroflexi bacterium]|nr:hypothetical protein [Chloroflexota bacterium]
MAHAPDRVAGRCLLSRPSSDLGQQQQCPGRGEGQRASKIPRRLLGRSQCGVEIGSRREQRARRRVSGMEMVRSSRLANGFSKRQESLCLSQRAKTDQGLDGKRLGRLARSPARSARNVRTDGRLETVYPAAVLPSEGSSKPSDVRSERVSLVPACQRRIPPPIEAALRRNRG